MAQRPNSFVDRPLVDGMQILTPIVSEVNGEKKLNYKPGFNWVYAQQILPKSALEKLRSVCMELAQRAAVGERVEISNDDIFTTVWYISSKKGKPFRLYVAQVPHLPIRIAITRTATIVCTALANATAPSLETTSKSYCIHSSDSGRVHIRRKYNSLEVFGDDTFTALFGKDTLERLSERCVKASRKRKFALFSESPALPSEPRAKKNHTKGWSVADQAFRTMQLLMSKLANGNPSGPAFGMESLMDISQTDDDSRFNGLQPRSIEALLMAAMANEECTITTDNPKLETLVKLRASMAVFVEHLGEVSKQIYEEVELQGLISILANEDYIKIRTAPSQATPSPMTT